MTHFSEQSRIYTRLLDPNGQDSLAKIARLVKPGSQVLDLGAGPGVLGQYLSGNLACTVDGVEYNPLAAEMAASYYRRLEAADLEQISLSSLFQEVQYDYIVCADILEHLRDPGRLVDQLAGLLKSEGRVLISIPNVAYAGLIAGLLADEFCYRPEGLLDKTHLRFFTRSSLLAFLAERGFTVCSQDSVVMDLRESEFRARYLDAFPPALVRGLLARPDALTYQFIIEAKKVDGQSQQVPAIPTVLPELRFACQLFWRGESNEYSEQNSSFAFGGMGKDNQTLSLPILPSSHSISALRLDLSDRPGFLHLFEIGFWDAEGRIRWAWDGLRKSLEVNWSRQVAFSDIFPAGQGVTVLLTGEDPGLQLPIPSESLANMQGGGELKVQVSWPMSMDYLTLSQHCVSRKDMETLRTVLESRNTSLKVHNDELESRNASLESHNATLAIRQRELESQNAGLVSYTRTLEISLDEWRQRALKQGEEMGSLRQSMADIHNSTIWKWSRPYASTMIWLRRKLQGLFPSTRA